MCDTNTKEKSNGTRLRRLLLDGGTEALRDFFDRICPSTALTRLLKNNETYLRNKCFDGQINLLFPSVGQPTSKNFDITLLALLLSNICGLKAPSTGWKKKPLDSDKSKEANIVRIRLFRNKLQHTPNSGISDTEFKKLWDELSAPLIELGFPKDKIKILKIIPIHDASEIQERFQKLYDHEERIKELEKTVEGLKESFVELLDRTNPKQQNHDGERPDIIESCIPDSPFDFCGRMEELKQVVDAKRVGEPFVLVHGMAGIGKSTLIKKASWDLHNTFEKIIYYVDFCRCKASEQEILKTITSVIYRGKSVNEPREALNNWARNLKVNVILALDNAEDVLRGLEDDISTPFKEILLEIRKYSCQKVSFLIASREVFDLSDLNKTEIKLSPLPRNESLDVIKHYSGMQNLDDDLGKKIAELCFDNPLALRIVGSLLETKDFEAREIINKLESPDKKDVLKKVENAVSLSFEKVDEKLFESFALLTVFAGSFTANDAKAVIERDKIYVVQGLQNLLKKSLLQKDKGRYSMHPFIQEYVVDKQTKEQLQKGEVNFLKHYLTLFIQNSDLYWTHDRCKISLKKFFDDSANFEKALKMSFETPRLWANIDDGLRKLKNLVMYLESCISWDQIKRLLDCYIELARERKLPSRELEFICWKGHIVRRKGDPIYEDLVKQADKIFESASINKETTELDDDALVCYKTAKGRYLGYKGDREGGLQIFNEVVEICQGKKEKNPSMNEDYARAIVELGHNLKNKDKKYDEAVKKYEQAIGIYETHLGEHIHTALGYKDLADGYLIQETQENFEKALKNYTKAIEMLRELNNDSGTHVILLLKNTGICYRHLKEYEESKKHLMKAKTIAEEYLGQNHKYNCWVNEELAYLYDDIGKTIDAKMWAKKANDMAKKLNLDGDWLKDKERLQKILSYCSEKV